MLRQLLLLLLFCLFIVVAEPLTKDEIATIKADLDKEVAKLGETHKSDNDIVASLLKQMKDEDTKRGYHNEQLATITVDEAKKAKKEIPAISSKEVKKESAVPIPAKQDTDELYQLLISSTTRSAEKSKSVQKEVTQKKKDATSDGGAEAAKLMKDSIQQEDNNKNAADKELMDAIIKSFQQNKQRSENEELVQALLQNQKEIKKKEAAESKDDLDLDLRMLSKKNVDMTRAILETYIANELKKKDGGKKEEAKDTQKHSLEESLLQAIINDEVQKRKKETKKTEISAKESDTKDIQNVIKDVTSEDVMTKTKDEKKEVQKDSKLSLEKSLLEAIMNDEAQKKKRVVEHPAGISKDELRDTNVMLEELINVVELKKKELQMKNMKNILDIIDIDVGEDNVIDIDVGEDGECEDKILHCETLKEYCVTHKKELKQKCRKTCNYCKCRRDIWKKTSCARMEKMGYCISDVYKEKLKKFCYKTCGHCRVPSPPACQMHTDGCCWDKTSFVSKGCPVCEDNFAIGKICNRFKDACNSTGDPGRFMKLNCPVTCNLCDPFKECKNYEAGHPCEVVKHLSTCKDSAEDGTCRMWKKSQGCGMFKDLAEKWCLKTCFNCHHNHKSSSSHKH